MNCTTFINDLLENHPSSTHQNPSSTQSDALWTSDDVSYIRYISQLWLSGCQALGCWLWCSHLSDVPLHHLMSMTIRWSSSPSIHLLSHLFEFSGASRLTSKPTPYMSSALVTNTLAACLPSSDLLSVQYCQQLNLAICNLAVATYSSVPFVPATFVSHWVFAVLPAHLSTQSKLTAWCMNTLTNECHQKLTGMST